MGHLNNTVLFPKVLIVFENKNFVVVFSMKIAFNVFSP